MTALSKLRAWWGMRLGPRWLQRRAARRAITRCNGVPYLNELTRREHHGMALLEKRGEVERDYAGISLHWHRRPNRLA